LSSTPVAATPGVALVTTRRVDPNRVADYQQWSERVQRRLTQVPGFVSAEQLPAVPGQQDFWTQIVRFSNKDDSLRWVRSPELAALLREIEPYTRNAEVSAVRIGDNDWLNFGLSTKAGPGAPPKWKQLIAGVMALYPTVIVIHHLLDRFLDLPFALSVLLTNAVAMALVMMVFLPQLSRVLHGWLLPSAPLPASRNIGVAALLLGVIGGCLALFLVLFPG
jgi:antibiotic biosynthesis monooxygenase (ABM) superfamily enzyme